MKTQYLPRDWKLEQFGDGPWMDEPDHAEWRHRAGYPCIVVRSPAGAWAAYVGVAITHPLYHLGPRAHLFDANVVVADFGYGRVMADESIVEIVADPSYWFFGFDYMHGSDFMPQYEKFKKDYGWRGASQQTPSTIPIRSLGQGGLLDPPYADFTYVRERVERLADQLELIEQNPD